MLLKLSDDQVVRYWEDIKDAIVAAVPPLAESGIAHTTQLLENILMGQLQVWILAESKGNDLAVDTKGTVVTTVWKDIGTGARSLLIYALWGYSFIEAPLWQDGLETLRKFARAERCTKIVSYSKVPRIIQIAEGLGANTETRLITLEV